MSKLTKNSILPKYYEGVKRQFPKTTPSYETFISGLRNKRNIPKLYGFLDDKYGIGSEIYPNEFQKIVEQDLSKEPESEQDELISELDEWDFSADEESASVEILQKRNTSVKQLSPAFPEFETATPESLRYTAQQAIETSNQIKEDIFDNMLEDTKETNWDTFKSRWNVFFRKTFAGSNLIDRKFVSEDGNIDWDGALKDLDSKYQEGLIKPRAQLIQTFKALDKDFKNVFEATQPVETVAFNASSTLLNTLNNVISTPVMVVHFPVDMVMKMTNSYDKAMNKNPDMGVIGKTGTAAKSITGAFVRDSWEDLNALVNWAPKTLGNLLASEPYVFQPLIRTSMSLAGKPKADIDNFFDKAERNFYSKPVDPIFAATIVKGAYSKIKKPMEMVADLDVTTGIKRKALNNLDWKTYESTKFTKGSIVPLSVKDVKAGIKFPENTVHRYWALKGTETKQGSLLKESDFNEIKIEMESGSRFDEAFDNVVKDKFWKTFNEGDLEALKKSGMEVGSDVQIKFIKKSLRDYFEKEHPELFIDLDKTDSFSSNLKAKDITKGVEKLDKSLEAVKSDLGERKVKDVKNLDDIPEGLKFDEFKEFFGVDLTEVKRKGRKKKVELGLKQAYDKYLESQMSTNELAMEIQIAVSNKLKNFTGTFSIESDFKEFPYMLKVTRNAPSVHQTISSLYLEGAKLIKSRYPGKLDQAKLVLLSEKSRDFVKENHPDYLEGYDLWHKMAKFGKDALSDQGINVDFKQRIVESLKVKLEQHKKSLSDHKDGKNMPNVVSRLENLIKETNKAIKKAENMEFVHAPTRMWLEDAVNSNNNFKFNSGLSLINGKKRKNILIADLVDEGIVKPNQLNMIDVFGSYGRRVAHDVSLGSMIKEGRKSGLIDSHWKKKKGRYVVPDDVELKEGYQIIGKGFLKGYSTNPRMYKYFSEYTSSFNPNSSFLTNFEKYMRLTKVSQFARPFIMGIYDIGQASYAGTFDTVLKPGAGFLAGSTLGNYSGQVLANALGFNSDVGSKIGATLGGVTGTALGWGMSKKSRKAIVNGFKSAWKKDDNYWKAEVQGTFSTPVMLGFDNFTNSLDNIKNVYGEKFWDRIGIAKDRFYDKWKNANAKEKAQLMTTGLAKSTVGKSYRSVWDFTWTNDRYIRMMTREYFKEQGYDEYQASRYAATFHGAYDNLPRHTARQFNRFLFTPTFKFAMGNLVYQSMTGALGLRGKQNFKIYGSAALRAAGIFVATDYMMTRVLNMERRSYGRSYSVDVTGDDGLPKDLVFNTIGNPLTFFFKNMEFLQQTFKGDYPIESDSFFKQWADLNYSELHPVWRITNGVLFDPQKFGIYDGNDDLDYKIGRTAQFMLYSHFPIFEEIKSLAGDPFSQNKKQAQRMINEQFGRTTKMIYDAVGFYYLTGDQMLKDAYDIRNFRFRMSSLDINSDERLNNYMNRVNKALENFGVQPDYELYNWIDENVRSSVRKFGLEGFEKAGLYKERKKNQNPFERRSEDYFEETDKGLKFKK